ncbi:MAG: J domain-containing protein [Gammaproteobacteria bacterium]
MFRRLLEKLSLAREIKILHTPPTSRPGSSYHSYLSLKQFETARDLTIQIIVLEDWNIFLASHVPELKEHTIGMFYALDIQRLLSDKKGEYFINWYKDRTKKEMTLIRLKQYVAKFNDAKSLFNNIFKSLLSLENSTKKKEEHLKTYSWPQAILASEIRTIGGFHYKTFRDILELEKIQPRYHSACYIRVMTSLFATGLSTIVDMKCLGTGAILCSAANYQGQRLIANNIQTAIALSGLLHLNKTRVINYWFPATKQLTGLGFYILLKIALNGWNPKDIFSELAGYLANVAGAAAAGKIIDIGCRKAKPYLPYLSKTFKPLIPYLEPIAPYLLIIAKYVAGLATHMAVNRLTPTLEARFSRFFYPPSETALLENKGMCLEQPIRCELLAKSKLGLFPNATATEIKEIVRKKAFELHSSLEHADDKEFAEILQAETRLRDLNILPTKKQ